MHFKDTGATQQITLKNNLLLILRHAEPNDAERLLAFLEQVAGESDNIAFGPGEFGMTVEEERRFLQQCAESPTSLFLIAEIAGEIAGTLTFNANHHPRLRHSGEFGMSVLHKYWNLGVGSHMLTYLIDWARQTKTIRKIDLHVRVDNLPAIHLYQKHGFVQEGLLRRGFFLRGQFVDLYMMGLVIDPI